MKKNRENNYWIPIIITNWAFIICITIMIMQINDLELELDKVESNSILAQEISTETDAYLENKIKSNLEYSLSNSSIELEKIQEEIMYLNIVFNDMNYVIEKHLDQRVILTEEELKDFGELVMAESGGESFEAQKAVASTIINRMLSPTFPNTFHEVMHQKNAFSVTFDGSLGRYETSQSVKDAITLSLLKDYSDGSLYFLNRQLAIDQGYENNVNHMMKSFNFVMEIDEITFLKEK